MYICIHQCMQYMYICNYMYIKLIAEYVKCGRCEATGSAQPGILEAISLVVPWLPASSSSWTLRPWLWRGRGWASRGVDIPWYTFSQFFAQIPKCVYSFSFRWGKTKKSGSGYGKGSLWSLVGFRHIQTSTSIMETIHYKLCLSMDIGQTFALRKFQDAFIWLCLKTGYPIGAFSFFILFWP